MPHIAELLPDTSSEQHPRFLFVIPQLRDTLHCKYLRQSKLFRQFAHSSSDPSDVVIDDTSQGHQVRERELGTSSLARQSEKLSASNFHSSHEAARRRSEYDHDVPSGRSGVST